MTSQDITFHAFICTRNRNLSETTENLTSYLQKSGVNIKLLVDQSSIFGAYNGALNLTEPNDNDIIILCHDDIEIYNSPENFRSVLYENLILGGDKVGFVGTAGTTELGETAVWWDQTRWQQGKHRGFVIHSKDNNLFGNEKSTYYGPYGEVISIDGLFLAARAKTLRRIGLEKPEYFTGEWDFYDIYYTYRAIELGMKNRVVPLFVRHESIGELAGRDSWHQNREAFILQNRLPRSINENANRVPTF